MVLFVMWKTLRNPPLNVENFVMNVENNLHLIRVCLGARGVAQIQTILGIIVLSFQVLLIIYKCVVRIINHAKNKDVNAIQNDLEETIDDLQKLSDKDKDGK